MCWTCREVARWMKAWDATVFGKKRQQDQQSAQAMAGMSKTARAVLRAKSQAAANDTRPEQRLILMCGPPGGSMHAYWQAATMQIHHLSSLQTQIARCKQLLCSRIWTTC
jgi:hypothetical protein